MSSGCGCGGGRAERGFEIVDASTLTGLLTEASRTDASYTTQKVVRIGNRLAVASGTADGRRGCFTLPILGLPLKVCWEVIKLDIDLPQVDVEIKFVLSVGDLPAVTRTVTLRCDNVLDPGTCEVTITPDRITTEFRALDACDWQCAVKCAPGCISCNTDPWCWVTCALKCLIECCL